MQLRGRGGFCFNPTCRMVRLTLRHILSTQDLKISKKANVSCPEGMSLCDASRKIEFHEILNEIPISPRFLYNIDNEIEDEEIKEDVENIEDIISEKKDQESNIPATLQNSNKQPHSIQKFKRRKQRNL